MVASAKLWFATGALVRSRMLRIVEPSLVVNGRWLEMGTMVILPTRTQTPANTTFKIDFIIKLGHDRCKAPVKSPPNPEPPFNPMENILPYFSAHPVHLIIAGVIVAKGARVFIRFTGDLVEEWPRIESRTA